MADSPTRLASPRQSAPVAGIIDGDIHPWLGPINSIFPYISDSWRRRLEPRGATNFMTGAPGRSPHFGTSILKADANPPGGGLPGSDPEFLAKNHLDSHGIAAALMLVIEGGWLESWTDPDEAAAVARGLNELMADRWLSADRRLHLAMAISPHDPSLAAAEIRRFGPTERVAAMWLPMIRRPMGDRYFHPIYEAAQEHQLPIFIHPTGSEGDFDGSPGYAGGVPPLKAERMTLLGEIAMTNVVSLIFQGTFERYPGLKVCFTEYGFSWVPPLLWRMDSVWKSARQSMPWVLKPPSEYFVDHIRVTSEPAMEIPNETLLQQVLDNMHASRTLLYSSDYPHWDGEEDPSSVFKTTAPELRARIFRENAIEVFGKNLVLSEAAAAVR